MRIGLAAAILLMSATSAQAQDAPKCTAVVAPPAELSAWAAPVSVAAAADANVLAKAVLFPGKAVEAALSPTSAVRYAVAPEKEGDASSYGGMFSLDVKASGTYRIALGAGAWIDIFKDGKAVVPSSHSHGPDCTGIRKMVDFALTPGRYSLQIENSRAAKVTTLIVKLR